MTNAYPASSFIAPPLLRKVDGVASIKEGRKLTFLYIGEEKIPNHAFSTFFQDGIFIESFEHAKKEITAHYKEIQFDVIFIDKKLDESKLRDVCTFLKEKKIFWNTVLIYNNEKLDIGKANFLKKSELIDDALNLSIPNINYSNKISFLKKHKSRQGNLTPKVSIWNKRVKQEKADVFFKRVLDILVASLILICLIPLFLIIALAIKLESRGPIFYTSHRAGRGFKVFSFYKFRTMVVDADKKINELMHLNQYSTAKGATFLKICNDPRVTKTGKFLRKTSLDELPQLINVLKGDMSLVGNRPLPLYEASSLTTNDAVERFMAPAGITGLWQIKKRGKDEMSVEERINLDIIYARKGNFIYDLWIMANTPAALLQKSDV